MPPITRLQNCSKKTKPYSKENRPSDKRTALFDLNVSILKNFFMLLIYKRMIKYI